VLKIVTLDKKSVEVSLEIIVSLKEDVWNNPLWKDLGRNYHEYNTKEIISIFLLLNEELLSVKQ